MHVKELGSGLLSAWFAKVPKPGPSCCHMLEIALQPTIFPTCRQRLLHNHPPTSTDFHVTGFRCCCCGCIVNCPWKVFIAMPVCFEMNPITAYQHMTSFDVRPRPVTCGFQKLLNRR